MPWFGYVWRCLILSVELLAISRFMGKRLIANFTAVDFVVSITIGTITGAVIVNATVPLWAGMVALGFWAVFQWVNGWLERRFPWYQRLVVGKPIVLVRRGHVDAKALGRAQVDRDTLLSELRAQQIANLADVEMATLEPSGKIGVKASLTASVGAGRDLFGMVERERRTAEPDARGPAPS